jgi:pimeloyl-ACP methyl ester carboxylesterase
MMTPAIDHAALLGQRRSLVGIVTKPVSNVPGDRPGVIILNTGIVHRIGHHRMYVVLSRALAEAGHTVLRFDLSGLGDSGTRSDQLSPLDASLADIRDAVDWLAATHAVRRVILVGLCSGADHAVIYGASDPRVVGLVLMDPSVPPTPRYYMVLFARSLIHVMRTAALWKWLKRRVARARGRESIPRTPRLNNQKVREFLENAYRTSVERGVQILAVLTSGAGVGTPIRPYGHNYPGQLLEAFPAIAFDGRLRLESFSSADHLFTSEADRARLFEMVLEWAEHTTFAEPEATSGCDTSSPVPAARVVHASFTSVAK